MRTKTRALENISMNVIQEKMGEWERMGDFWLKPNRGKGGISPFLRNLLRTTQRTRNMKTNSTTKGKALKSLSQRHRGKVSQK